MGVAGGGDSIWEGVGRVVARVTGEAEVKLRRSPVGGGCIHSAWRVETGRGERFFVKTNRAACLPMFEAEAVALEMMRKTGTLRVPEVFGVGGDSGGSWLVLEHLELGSRGREEDRGRLLAALHRHASGDRRFGWERDNFIGETAQSNGWMEVWGGFFAERRLRVQLDLVARSRGAQFAGGEELVDRLPKWLQDHGAEPSLLHGDLWGGNAAFDESGGPVVFDPASYYGDRETDLAFTRLFGGFQARFYEAYEEAWPLPEGFEKREVLYNLYHLLNHYHLFGGSYGAAAQRSIDQVRSWMG